MDNFRSCSTCRKVMPKTRVNKCVNCKKRHRKFFIKHKIMTIILFSLAILTGVGAALNDHKNQASKVVKVKTSKINTSITPASSTSTKINASNTSSVSSTPTKINASNTSSASSTPTKTNTSSTPDHQHILK